MPRRKSAEPNRQSADSVFSLQAPQDAQQQDISVLGSAADDAPLPRAKRQRRCAKADRGLPPDQELVRLATEYLQFQCKHWPEMVDAGLLAETSAAEIENMVADFKRRHRTGQVDSEPLRAFLKLCKKLGGSYNRYSCDNSSPTSIIDQMINGLAKARQEDRFIPWTYVFCDYSVSGLSSSRQGYSSYKCVLSEAANLIETTYVDDFTRASREEIEWWKLAALSKRLGKRMIGSSDGFDLSAPDWDVKITIYGLVSRLFIKSLREKVKRGMGGAARRRTSLGKPSLGYTRCVFRNEDGSVVVGSDGLPIYKQCIDPETRPFRVLIHELFVQKCWPVHRITKHFNRIKVENWDGWTDAAIKKLLWNPTAIGVFIWNKTRREYDWEKEKVVVLENPRSQWVVHYDPSLAIIPMDWYRAARRRLSAMRRKSPLTGRKMSRNQRSATTLFSGTLFCLDCGHELLLYRSAGKYKVMFCHNGRSGAHGCKLSTSKSTRIIESSLIAFLQQQLLTEDAIEKLVSKANAYLAQEASRPRTSTTSLKKTVRKKEDTISQLFKRLEGQTNEELCQAYEKQIAMHQKDLNNLKAELWSAEKTNELPPPPLDSGRVKSLLAELPTILNLEIPAAAEAIRALTGPISIRQETVPGKKRGAKWIASFNPDLVAWLYRIAKATNCPDSITLEFLCARNWTKLPIVQIDMNIAPTYEQIASRVHELKQRGSSITAIAASMQKSADTVRDANSFAESGSRPKLKKKSRRAPGKPKPRYDFAKLVPEVLRLRDIEKMPFTRIGEKLGVPTSAAQRAYDIGSPDAIRKAVEDGRRPTRGRYGYISREVLEQVRERLKKNEKPSVIARDLKVGNSTVYRILRSLRHAG